MLNSDGPYIPDFFSCIFVLSHFVSSQFTHLSCLCLMTLHVLLFSEHRIVTKLRATAVSSESIRLTWKLPKQTNETVAYAILWSELDTEQSERTAVVANGSVSFTLDKLTPHRLYSFRVQSMLSEGPGGSTEKVIARPFSDKPGKAPRNVGLKYSNDSVRYSGDQ